ncbi:MAG: alpha/beta fold hydrolase [Syntrophaceae bacterium]|nr:alpha/beta fold hydrolase [Syntrophaceae bacterium]
MSKNNLLLLHGALGSKSQFSSLVPFLEKTFQIHVLDFEGHGSSPLKNRPFRLDHFSENVLDYLSDHSLNCIDIFGYSMGGHVGLYLAQKHPEKINQVFTLATKFLWTPELAEREVASLDVETVLKKVPQFAKVLEERHAVSGWKNVLEKTKEMFLEQGKNNPLPLEEMRNIHHMVRIGVGDRDKMVSLEESIEAYHSLPQGELQIFPKTPHPLEKVPLSNLVYAIVDFFSPERR